MLAESGTITLEQIRESDHGVIYGERTMGHFLEFFRKEARIVDICPERLAGDLRKALAGDSRIARPATGQYRIISRRRNGMMNSSLTETSGSIGNDETADAVEMNTHDGRAAGIDAGDLVEIRSATGTFQVRAILSDDIRRSTVVLAQGWGSPLFDPASSAEVFRRGNERNKLVSDADPLSAVPRLNGTLVAIKRVARVQH